MARLPSSRTSSEKSLWTPQPIFSRPSLNTSGTRFHLDCRFGCVIYKSSDKGKMKSKTKWTIRWFITMQQRSLSGHFPGQGFRETLERRIHIMKQKGELLRQSLISEGWSTWGLGSWGDFLTGLEVHLATLGWLQFGRGRIVQGWVEDFLCWAISWKQWGMGLLAAMAGRLSSLSTAYGQPRGRNHVSHVPCMCFTSWHTASTQSYFQI